MKLYEIKGLCALMLVSNVSISQAAEIYANARSIAEIIQERPNLVNYMGVVADVNQWDNEILGLIDQETYNRETAITEEQKVDIEFQLSHEEQEKRLKEQAKEDAKAVEKLHEPEKVKALIQKTLKNAK